MIRSPYIYFLGSLMLILGVGTAYGFWYHTVIHESARLAVLTERVDARGNNTQQSIASKAALHALFSNEEAIAGYFLSADDVVSFLERLEKIGQSLGSTVSVASVSNTPAVAADGSALPDRLVLSLTIKGSFEGVMKTVGAIEYGPYDISITNLTLGSSFDEKKHTVWTANGLFSVGIHSTKSTP
jgi:hypothetical protein